MHRWVRFHSNGGRDMGVHHGRSRRSPVGCRRGMDFPLTAPRQLKHANNNLHVQCYSQLYLCTFCKWKKFPLILRVYVNVEILVLHIFITYLVYVFYTFKQKHFIECIDKTQTILYLRFTDILLSVLYCDHIFR